MWKPILTLSLIVVGAALLFPRGGNAPTPESVSPAAEIRMKQDTLNQDVALTDELCRTQCSMELRRTVQDLKAQPKDQQTQTLKHLQMMHPHMEQLTLTAPGRSLSEGNTVGTLKESVRTAAAGRLEEAKRRVDAGAEYQSEPFQADSGTYFVLGVPAGQGQAGLVGVVRQHILQEVTDHQLKNLRIVTYPREGRYKTESVDSRTLENVQVNHPEDNEGTSHYHKNQVVVRFKQDPTPETLKQIRQEIGGAHVQKIGYTYVFESGSMEAKQLMSYFKKWNIEYAEPHFLYLTNDAAPKATGTSDTSSVITPNDSLYRKYQWNLPIIDTEAGWNVTKGSNDVIVGVVDTGVDLNHQDLKDQLVSGFNVVNPDQKPQDDVGHGTHVAGTVGAIVNNNLGIAGMSWYNRIMPVKVLDSTGAGSTYAVAQGIIWATDHGAKVINMSLGNYADAQFLHDAIKYAYDRDVVLIAASGNDNTDRPGYPAAYPEVLAVAATDAQKNKASFSNYGDYIAVAAPGVSIASTYPHNQYAALSGTSMASPHVTALAALIRSVNPSLKNTEVMQIMRDTAMDIGPAGKDQYFGHGLIDVVAALKAAQPAAQRTTPDTTLQNQPQLPADQGASGLQRWFNQMFR
ncbi:S8 family peptidase [Paenibacillus filicis]|uniref:S8 family peptidase n=1 Tax=Paenibacillus gyeongsangnamensis TaxID=3388067 RepID=A0ABT4Q2S9_9BACL|nr:S8 family peptidase [Paenibacillus filicis]MCZ8511190.1 S8 family peptidase [Paenibacillus filicis]